MMDHNPYSPPQTEVLEAPSEDAGPRPRQVTLAVYLFWGDSVLSAAEDAVQMLSKDGDPYWVASLIFVGALLTAEVIVIYSLWKRRNWARYVALLSSVLGLLEFAESISSGRLTSTPGEMAMEAVSLVLDAIALFLLFVSPGKEWFKQRKAG
jgi:uncharacterized membrane protein (DUF2068 family)